MNCLQAAPFAGLTLRNRIAVAPMTRGQANQDGSTSPAMAGYYAHYARHGAGLIFTEALFTDMRSARAYFGQPGLSTDAQAESWRGVIQAVHREGGRIFAQIQHGGRLAEPGLNPVHLAASDGIADGNTWQTGRPNAPARAATPAEIDDIVAGFAQAARRAAAVGFDGIELHGARGYLLDDFLSAGNNRRSDAYGGSLQGRLALPLRVARAVRQAAPHLPLSYNMALYKIDNMAYQPPGGAQEIATIAQALHEAGVMIFHLTNRRVTRPEPWGETLAQTIRQAVPDALIIGNGGLKTLEDCQQAIDALALDAVSLARPFLANPDWIPRMLSGAPLATYAPGDDKSPLRVAGAACSAHMTCDGVQAIVKSR